MSTGTVAVATLVIALCAAAVALGAALLEGRRPAVRRWSTVVFGLLALASAAAYPRFGHLRGPGWIVHSHEQFHFFIGSKYLEEVRYDGLYLATAAAEAEARGGYGDGKVRDLGTFEKRRARDLEGPAEMVKRRFSPERWEAFKADLDVLDHDLRANTRTILTDHGNTGSPSWAAVTALFTATLPLSKDTGAVFALLDPALLLVLFGFAWRAFGARTAFLAAILGFLPVRAWAYLGGSILRLDWLFAVGMTACLFGLRKHRSAGLALAYAISSKPFTAVIALALGVRMLVEARRQRRIVPEHAVVVASAVVGLALWVAVSSAVFGGFEIWRDYVERILITLHEGYYRSQFSLRDVYLQASAHPLTFLFDPTPGKVQASLSGVDIADHTVGFLLVRVVVLGALYWVASRHDVLFSFWIGALSVFVVFVTNMYYWQLWLVLALAAGRDGAARRNLVYVGLGLLVVGLDWVPAIGNWSKPLQGYFGSFLLAWLVIITVATELFTWVRERREGGDDSTAATSRRAGAPR